MSDATSLVLYLLTFALSAGLLGYGYHQKNKIMQWASLLPTILLASARFGVGTDYNTYVSLFNQFSALSLGEYIQESSTAEPGFYLLIQISNFITGDSYLMFSLAAIITSVFFYLGLRRYDVKHPALVYFLYLTILFPMTLNVMRQGIAISICFYAFSFIMERNFKKYLIWILIASLFHISALLLLPVYFVNRLVKPKRQNAYPAFLIKLGALAGGILLLVPLAITLVMQLPMFSKYDMYSSNGGEGANLTIFLQIAVLLLGIALARWAVSVKNGALYMFLLIFATLEIVFATIGFSSTFIKRIGLYFSIFGFMLLSESTSIFKDRIGKILVMTFVVLYGVAYFIIAYYILGQSDVFPYTNILAGGMSK